MKTNMSRMLSLAVAGAAAVGFSAAAIAAPPQAQRIRGTIQSINGQTITVQPYGGGSGTKVMLSSGTKYAWVVKSSLSSLKKGDFIGTAAMGPENHMTAQEVVIFPQSMKGTGEGHYPWTMPAAVAQNDAGSSAGAMQANGTPPVQGTMTNGTVSSTSSASASAESGAPPVQGTMTNGTVSSTRSQTGGKTLTISYNNGQKVQVTVPPNIPIVRFHPASKSILKQGEKAFIVAGPKSNARFVAVGKNGLMPPM